MEEIWKDIVGYEGLYQVSNTGRIRSVSRIVTYHKHFGDVIRPKKGEIMSTAINKRDGYEYIRLYKDNERKGYKVHRLVAKAFIPNPNNLPCINHKDEKRANNNVDNLEWCTYAYNNEYGNHLNKISESNKGKKRSDETRKRMSECKIGTHLSEATKRKLSEINMGEKNPNYGLKRSKETIEKMKLARQGFRMPESSNLK